MKLSIFTTSLVACCASAASIPKRESGLRTIELSPTDIRQVTEEEKIALLDAGTRLIDITEAPASNKLFKTAASVTFPSDVSHQAAVEPLLAKLSAANLKANLEPYVQFQNRYYNSTTGIQASEWLLKTVQDVVTASGAVGVSASPYKHSFPQNSVIVKIPGQSNKTVIVGAHLDSVNGKDADKENNRSPGADDDGSGTVTILEAMRVLLTDEDVKAGKSANTIEFHWYAAEELGLLGSVDILGKYKEEGKDVKAMLQQDMTGYSKGTTDKGKPDAFGVITDFVDAGLTTFVTKAIDAYCKIGYVETECGYGCSDHASAYRNGFPSSFIFESDFADINPNIHSAADTIDTLDFDHMLEHAKLSVGVVYELANTPEL